MVKLYNTLTRRVEELEPIDQANIRVYSCGPTVYDRAHIGNLASYIFADTLRRVLTLPGSNVTQVMNITDVDDKTIKRSRQDYSGLEPMAALETLTSRCAALFFEDMKKVGNDISNVTFVRATDHIESMKQLVTELYTNGFAYIADDGVYFSIDAYRRNGKTYGQLVKIDSQNTSRARIANDEYDKQSAHDFALWKSQKQGEPAWEFVLDGKDVSGRPGWHIECSAMSKQILGQPFDIHTGGVDLMFPHHENEIAQSTAGEENPTLATVFAHNEHILVDGKKMSKSLNNFITLDDIVKKGYDPLALRLLVLQSHYKNQAHFSWQNLQAAQSRLQTYRNMAVMRWQSSGHIVQADQLDLNAYQHRIQEVLEYDLGTVRALAALSAMSEEIEMSNNLGGLNQQIFTDLLIWLDGLLGLDLTKQQDITSGQKQLIAKRQEARQAKDWPQSDDLREQLKQQGIGLRDTENGAIWYRQ